jgi:hypothetical protein
MVVVFYEESIRNPQSIDNLETLQMMETARLYGCCTHLLPVATGYPIAAEDALADLPTFVGGASPLENRPHVGIWAGFIPSQAKYEAVYTAAATKNVFLVNDPIQYQTALEFDRYYPLLGDLTRLFVYQRQILAFGHYWDAFEDEYALTAADRSNLHELAIAAATRVNVPYLIIDIGQLAAGDWIVIEVGDAQFAGMSHVSMMELWSQLATIELPC